MNEPWDEALRLHIGEARDLWLAQYTGAELPPHAFSARFVRRMAALIRKQKRSPSARRAFTIAKRAAVLLLVLLLCGGLFLAVNTEARAAVLQWFRETFSHSVLYRFPEAQTDAPLPACTMGWVPEGFELSESYYDESTICFFTYRETDGSRGFSLDYSYMFDGTHIELLNIDDPGRIEAVEINGMDGEFCPANDPSDYSSLVWFDEPRGIVFDLAGDISREDILHIAREVKLEDPTK